MKQRKIGYAIMEAENLQELSMKVQTMLAQGFMPNGGITIAGTLGLVGPQGPHYYQTMIAIEEIEVPDDQHQGLTLVKE